MDTPTPRCARCGDPFLPEQDGQKYCSVRCREASKKRRQRFRLRRGKDAGELLVPPGTGVTRDDGFVTDPGEDLREFSDYNDLIGVDDEPESGNAFLTESMQLQALIDKRVEEFEARLAPLLETQKRNPGPELPQITRLRREYAKELDPIIQKYNRAAALERAALQAPQRAIRAQERQDGIKAMADFSRDLGRGGRYTPEPAGRGTTDVFAFPEQGSVFGSDREMWQRSEVARNMNFSAWPGDERSMRW